MASGSSRRKREQKEVAKESGQHAAARRGTDIARRAVFREAFLHVTGTVDRVRDVVQTITVVVDSVVADLRDGARRATPGCATGTVHREPALEPHAVEARRPLRQAQYSGDHVGQGGADGRRPGFRENQIGAVEVAAVAARVESAAPERIEAAAVHG